MYARYNDLTMAYQVVLSFTEPFWGGEMDLFGLDDDGRVVLLFICSYGRYTSDRVRGENFMFWSLFRSTKKATLIALCSGPSAVVSTMLSEMNKSPSIGNRNTAQRGCCCSHHGSSPRYVRRADAGASEICTLASSLCFMLANA